MKKNQPCKKLKKIMNKLVLKNLAICLGISLAVGSISCPVGELFSEQVEAATSFADDASIRDYSRTAVENLVSIGSIKGYPDDNTFRPQGTITRIEYYSMAANAFDSDGSKRAKMIQDKKNYVLRGRNVYNSERALYNNDIAEVWGGKAEDLIMLSGDLGVGLFCGESSKYNGHSGWLAPVTRAEAAQMLVVCMEKFGGEKLEIKENIESIIGDYYEPHSDRNAPTNDMAAHNVRATNQENHIKKLYSAGIVKGSNEQGDFFPQDTLTREQAAQTIYLAVNKDKRSAVNVAPLPKEEKRAATTIDLTDPDRITALPGDTVIDANGNKHVVGEIAGVPYIKGMALDIGRKKTKDGEIMNSHSVSDGSFDGIRLGDAYCVSPNGTGLWESQWRTLMEYYCAEQNKKGPGTAGQTVKVGDDNWLELEWLGDYWSIIPPAWS